ncbi:alpha/beta hydrolase [Actinosynnema pretiosum subsp. pretiosum]|uniref:Alpha/beta hydrolase fold-3 domain protein n=2 Tax=Actinosynnema TaxID=40566 RepID=C6WMX1_ACTMD|nr:alpha/beta hydrolase [Actinosynnema mirum]ACU38484.1 Alpha/beta hydrolase fold-3 domain protein [Actinosynnema mirum DSM 43827]AXX32032.1 Lipase/esterase [Actinosynnema pretiosum subsp. pretiosum]QUF03999.1 alpha/beta hydrolase [Actinosynnema pretiosum subsp. pretiosum]
MTALGHDWTALVDPELVDSARAQPYVSFTDPLKARRNFARACKLSRALLRGAPDPVGVEVVDTSFPVPGADVGLRVYRPAAAPTPPGVLVYFHGGAFVAGDLDSEHHRCLGFAAAGVAVVSVDYRRPPEHPFPVPGEDCYAAVEWVAGAAAGLGFAPERIAVGGSSAGATLAAAVALMARDRGGPEPALQVLLYPALDDRLASGSMRRYPETSSWKVADSALMWRHYLGDSPEAATSEYAVPARRADFTGVAPAYVLAAEVDALRDEAVDYAVRLSRDGVPVELHHVAGAFHGFDAAVPTAGVSARSLASQAAALRHALLR